MPYTLWSHGRLLGESELDYERVLARYRMGDFHPTDVGSRLMPIATGVSPAGIELSRRMGSSGLKLFDDALRRTSEYADFAAADDYYEALALELHSPDGSVIPTEWIDVRDLELLASLVIEDDPEIGESDAGNPEELDEGLDDEFSESWDEIFGGPDSNADVFAPERADGDWRTADPPPRYQLQVMLRDDAAIP